jgi:hypothetical protein
LVRIAEERSAVRTNFWSKITRSNFIIKLRNWEYWPFGVIQFPFFAYWLWLSLKARSLVFFSASNPGIYTGGMFGESKSDILEKIPAEYIARSERITFPSDKETVLQKMKDMDLSFPVIFKPDLGERGWMVKKVSCQADVEDYLNTIGIDFIVQELIDLPLEFGVFYRRFPSEPTGLVTSIVMKQMLAIEGDGRSTFKQLVLGQERAKLQWHRLRTIYQNRLNSIPAKGERIELISIGNHCLGTKFVDGSHLISEQLNTSFDLLSRKIPGFYFGRYDLRAASIDDLAEGKIKIMELNGCGAEPAHIYSPGYSLTNALKVMLQHWNDMYRVSIENNRRGVAFMSMREGIRAYKKFRAIFNSK